MLAATAGARGLIVVTRNVRHFDRILDVQVENWFPADPGGSTRAGIRARPRSRRQPQRRVESRDLIASRPPGRAPGSERAAQPGARQRPPRASPAIWSRLAGFSGVARKACSASAKPGSKPSAARNACPASSKRFSASRDRPAANRAYAAQLAVCTRACTRPGHCRAHRRIHPPGRHRRPRPVLHARRWRLQAAGQRLQRPAPARARRLQRRAVDAACRLKPPIGKLLE